MNSTGDSAGLGSLDEIASSLQGYDPQALPALEVLKFLEQLVKPINETESVGIFQALGRVLACDVISPISVPAHDNSAMDGFGWQSLARLGGAWSVREDHDWRYHASRFRHCGATRIMSNHGRSSVAAGRLAARR